MKKKIKDLTISDMLKYCYNNKECKECIFSNVEDECEVEFIRLHSDDYLEQEIEVEEDD